MQLRVAVVLTLAIALGAIGCGSSLPLAIQDEHRATAQLAPGAATVVLFTDFQCPFCRRTHAQLAPLLEQRRGEVRVVIRHVPLPRHPDARSAARAAVCFESIAAQRSADSRAGASDRLFEEYTRALFASADLSEAACERLAEEHGVARDALRRCLEAPSTDARIDRDLALFDGVQGDGVPLMYIGKTRLEGQQASSTLAAALDEAIGHAPRARAPAATPRSEAKPQKDRDTTGGSVLPFVHDDYPAALAEAKRRQKPLFVDAWAPWCHSCQSLRTYVLTDPSLAPLAGDFVWLSVDTEKDVNATFVAAHPHAALPTLWVIDPVTDRPLLKWAGTVTADELRSLLAASVEKGGAGGTEATAAFLRGNHALAEGDMERAKKEHRDALAAARGPGAGIEAQRARIVEALVTELSISKEHAACAELAAAEAGAIAPGTSRASAIVTGLGCAREAKLGAVQQRLLDLALRDATARDKALLPDDRSALYEEAVQTRKDLGDDAGARTLAIAWASFLETEAGKARTKDARASLDPLRLNAYLALGEPARALPMLEESARDFPTDYNPPARLGRVYLELRRLDEAQEATDRAIVLVYGPRAMRIFALSADIAKARGDRAGEIRALEAALARSQASVLTEGQRGVRNGLVKRLAGLR